MKILYIVHQFYPEFYTGTEKFVFNLATFMKDIGNEVKVLTYSFYEDSFYNKTVGNVMIREFEYEGINIIAFRYKEESKLIHYTLDDNGLDEVAKYYIKREHPDIVHVGHIRRMSSFVKVCIDLAIPYVVTLTDFFFLCQKIILINSSNELCLGPNKGRRCIDLCSDYKLISHIERFDIANRILVEAKKVFAPSKFVVDIFNSQIGNLDIQVINHGLDSTYIKKSMKKYITGDKIVFGFAGTFYYHKGLYTLLKAFKNIKTKNVSLKIYGSGADNKYVRSIMEEARKDERIELCGVYSKEEIGNIFNEIDVLVVPSLWYETYCLVLHEALLCNIPVIVSDIGVMKEKIHNGMNGFVFEMNNHLMLKKIMENIICNPMLINEMKSYILNQKFPSLEDEAYQYRHAYNSIITRK